MLGQSDHHALGLEEILKSAEESTATEAATKDDETDPHGCGVSSAFRCSSSTRCEIWLF